MYEPETEIADYLAFSQGKESSLTTYRSQLETLRRRMGRPLSTATVRDLADLKSKLRKDGQQSAPYYLRTLRGFYRKLGKTELADACRMPIKVPRLAPTAILTPADVARMIESANSKRDAALIGALWDTGGRISELLALDLKDVREENDASPPRYVLWFHQVKSDGQQHEGYVLDTSTALRAWLRSHPYPDSSSPVFCSSDGRRIARKRAWAIVREAARRGGISKHVHPHLFRHSRATALLRMGVSEGDVKRLLGWSDRSQSLSRYSHLTNRDAMRSLLAASGYAVPKPEEVGRVEVDEEKLVPVVPVVSSPIHRPPASPESVENAEQIAALTEELRRLKADQSRTEELLEKALAALSTKLA